MFANLFNRKPQGLGMFGGQPETYEAMGGYGPQAAPATGTQAGWQMHNPTMAMMGLGMLSGRNNAEAFGGALKGAAVAHEMQGGAGKGSMWTEKMKNYAFAKSQGYGGTFQEWMRDEGTDSEFGLNPQYGVDEQGNPVIIQLNKSGQAQKTPLPEGVSLSKEPIKLDAGTHFVLLDPITRQPVGQIPKDVAGAASQQAVGKAQGEARADLPNAVAKGEYAISVLDQLIASPGRELMTGKSRFLNPRAYMTGGDGSDFTALWKQTQGTAFLQAYEDLKGGGAISEPEGAKAEAAKARMDTAQSDEAFLAAAQEFRGVIERGIERAKLKAGLQPQGAGQGSAGGNQTSGGVQWRVVP